MQCPGVRGIERPGESRFLPYRVRREPEAVYRGSRLRRRRVCEGTWSQAMLRPGRTAGLTA